MYRLIIAHETRTLARAGALWSILALLVMALAFGAWSWGNAAPHQSLTNSST